LYTSFVKPITKHQALAEYVTLSPFQFTNGGAFKHAPENSVIMDKDEIALVSQTYSGLATMYVNRFYKWICNNTISEYKTYQDEVNASKSVTLTGGWHFRDERPTLIEADYE